MNILVPMRFLRDEQGGGTVWGLLWFMLMVGICGLAVDTTDGFRARTMLQATADATALAGAIDLPNPGAVSATAVSYSVDNMGTAINGAVLDPADVHVGRWDPVNRALDTGSLVPDAVMVTVHRSSVNGNALATNFLRIIGLTSWNVKAQAVAQRYIPECLRDGLIATEIVDISSNNSFTNRICIHGQEGVNIQSNNYFQTGVGVSMPYVNFHNLLDSDDMLEIPSSGPTSNDGLPEALREQSLLPRMVNHIDEIMEAFLDPESSYQPGYIDTDEPVIVVDEKFNLGAVLPNRIYWVKCKPNKHAAIPSGSYIREVVIIADCEVQIGAGATVVDAVIGSRGGANGKKDSANIGVPAGAQLGLQDDCATGGGVQLFSNASMHFSSSTGFDGVQLVAAGDIDLGARDMGINGISAQAGGTITMTSSNMFGLCAGGTPDFFTVPYYRLVL